MNLVADEGVDGPVVDRLRQDGHDVWYVAEMEPGIADEDILALANEGGSLLLTADKDFGELVFWQGHSMPGIVLIRLAGVAPGRKAEIVASVIRERAGELLGAFTVIAPRLVRVRKVGGG